MKTKIWLCTIAMALGCYTALAAPACADGYKSPAQIMEYATKLDNQGEKERAIKMYKALVAKYPDSRQAKMAQSRIDVLEGRVAEERAEKCFSRIEISRHPYKSVSWILKDPSTTGATVGEIVRIKGGYDDYDYTAYPNGEPAFFTSNYKSFRSLEEAKSFLVQKYCSGQ